MRSLGKPAFAELVCAGLALLCLLAPTWWTLEKGRSERLAGLETVLRSTATSSAMELSAWSSSVGAEVQLVAQKHQVVAAAATLLGSLESDDRETFLHAVKSSLGAITSGSATRFVLTDNSGFVIAENQPGADRLAVPNPPATAPWRTVTGRYNGSPNWPVAFSVPVEGARGRAGWLIYGVESSPAVRRALQSVSSFDEVGAYAISAEFDSWIVRTGSLGVEECQVPPSQLLELTSSTAGVASSGADVDGFDGCSGNAFGGWAAVPELGLLVVVETEAASAMKILRVGRMTTVGLAALLGAIILILIMLQTSDAGIGDMKSGTPRNNTAAWGILAVSLVATAIGGVTSQFQYDKQHQAELTSSVQRLTTELEDRIKHYGQAITSSASAYRVLHSPVAEDWVSFTRSLRLGQEFPAFSCLSLVLLDPRSEGGEFGTRGSADTIAETAPVPGGCPVGKPEKATVDQLALLGRRATETESLAAGILHWKSRGRTRDWLALVLPLTNGADVGAPRGGGWVVAFVDTAILMAGIEGDSHGDLAYALYEGAASTPGGAVFATEETRNAPAVSDRIEEELRFGGATWTISAGRAGSDSVPFEQNYPFQVVLAGLAISVLLFDIALVLSSTRARAIGIAALMTERFRDSEERIRAVIDHASDGIIAFDSSGCISTYNPGAEKLFSYTSDEVKGLRIGDLIPVCETRQVSELIHSSSDVATECVGISKTGQTFPAELTISRVLQVRGPDRFSAIVRDVTARKLTEEKLKESEERYALASRGANDGLWDWNLKTNEVYYSSRWKDIVGASDASVSAAPTEWFDRVHSDDIEGLKATLDAHLKGQTSLFESEHRVRHAEGGYRWVLSRAVAVRDEEGKASRLAGSQTDVTERKKAEKRLRYDAVHDQLTDLPNRSYFMEQLERARKAALERPTGLFGVLFMDVDRFKVVNDSLGHMIGDQLLVSIAGRLRASVRPGDTICRLGGDEFAVLVDRMESVDDATRLAERIQEQLQEPLRIGGHEVFAAVSIGISMSSDGRRTAEEMLRDADIAMYRAKSQGRGRYELFDRRMHDHAVEVLEIETDLRRAIERDELVLHYQPILDLVEQRVFSCEALLRWHHPRRGLLYPANFVSIAEETGVIGEIGRWLVQEACRQNREWRDAGLPEICVSVNISPRQFAHQDVAELVESSLAASGLEPGSLQLELTESALMESSESNREPLTRLYEKGVQISLDDFGTGYSSLVHLRRFPIHNIKIDQSFVERVPDDAGDVAVVSGLIGLAHTLGLKVIAEGVETPAQLEFLRDSGCDAVQGYLLGRPVPAESFGKLLAEVDHPVASALRNLQSTMPVD